MCTGCVTVYITLSAELHAPSSWCGLEHHKVKRDGLSPTGVQTTWKLTHLKAYSAPQPAQVPQNAQPASAHGKTFPQAVQGHCKGRGNSPGRVLQGYSTKGIFSLFGHGLYDGEEIDASFSPSVIFAL